MRDLKAAEDYLKKIDTTLRIKGASLDFSDLAIEVDKAKGKILTYCQSLGYLNHCIRLPHITAILCTSKDFQRIEVDTSGSIQGKTFIIVENPKDAFFLLHNFLVQESLYDKEEFETNIHPDARISSNASIAGLNVRIGAGTIVEDFAVIKENVSIGKNCRIQSGAIIGNDCLQCGISQTGVYDVRHSGGVILSDNVKVESNALVCRHIFNESTFVGENVKIGGLAHITHGCSIGANCIIAPNAFIGGGATLGEWCFVGANASLVPMVKIGSRVNISSGAVVTTGIEDNLRYSGNFAIEHSIFKKNLKNTINKYRND